MPSSAADGVLPWQIYCDGSASPNPGRMGLGAVLIAPGGSPCHSLSQATTATGCNNEAELRALQLALTTLHAQAPHAHVVIYSDNSVLVDQLTAHPHCAPIVRLATVFDDVRQLLARCASARLQWIPRHRNSAADTLARAALGLPAKLARPRSAQGKKRRK